MYTLEARHIHKSYAHHKALNDVSIAVPERSVFGLLGPNGAGKTSLIRIINQITGPDAGEILFNGRPLLQSDVEHIGYLPEERGLYKKMKVGEQCMYLAQLKGLPAQEANQRLKEWFERFEISTWWNKKGPSYISPNCSYSMSHSAGSTPSMQNLFAPKCSA